MNNKNRFYKAKNPHNQFLFDYFNNQKIKCLSTGRDKLVFGYQKILQALQKYPVPILTEEQASQLQGVGAKTSVMIVKLLNQVYAKEQNIALQINDAIIQDDLEENSMNTFQSNTCPTSLFETQPESQIQHQDFQDLKSKFRLPQNQFLNGLNECAILVKTALQEDNSKPKPTSKYVPPQGSKSWGILLALQKFSEKEDRVFATRKEIKKYSQSQFGIEIAQWSCLETLERYQLVKKTAFGDELKWSLTEDGEKMAERLCIQHQEKKPTIESEEEIDVTKAEVILLVDNRERYQSNNRQIIYEKLIQLHGVNCRLANLPVGDFLWIAKVGIKKLGKEYVLNCIVERKTISDLAHSITDKRYTDQKYRLKNCGLSRLFYLIEGATSTTSNLQVSKATVEKALRQTQIRDGFMVQQTENLEESLLWISRLTRTFKIQKEQLNYELQDFLNNNSNRSTTVLQQWGAMINSISGAGQELTKSLIERWPTPLKFFDEINSSSDRICMLQGKPQNASKTKTKDNLNSKVKMNVNMAKLIEIIFLSDIYPDDKSPLIEL